ncbi:SpoIIAA family protein [Rufibacter psychrotolerans]|uniref:STAS/SEC14 domain-containing protein n=1 Tax=Rufibacter psychrotolerans TaxID=2812556 RepID=UPI001966D991|nr:STAS/SEC14 domain-containing protein [Rufibacter sp. SYSU D00308]
MVEILNTQKPDLFAARLSGKVGKEEYDLIVPALEAQIAQQGKIDLYWEMTDFEGWSAGAMWEDIKFDVKHVNSFRKVAIVGDETWENTITKLIKPFTTAEVQFFPATQRAEAMAWVNLP